MAEFSEASTRKRRRFRSRSIGMAFLLLVWVRVTLISFESVASRVLSLLLLFCVPLSRGKSKSAQRKRSLPRERTDDIGFWRVIGMT